MDADGYKRVLVTSIAFFEGVTHLAALAVFYTLKDEYLLDPHQVAILSVLPTSPWLFKLFIAGFMDAVPIVGQHRRPYIMIGALLNTIGFLMIGILMKLSLPFMMFLLVLSAFGAALCSTASDALLLEIMQGDATNDNINVENNANHNAISQVTLYFGAKAVGSLIVSYASGALLEIWSKSAIFIFTALFPIVVGCLAYRVIEDKRTMSIRSLNSGYRRDIISKITVGMQTIRNDLLFYPILFNLCFIVVPDYDDALMFFIINRLHFSSSFLGTLKLTYGLASLVGLTIYQAFLTKVHIKKVLLYTTLTVFPFYIAPLFMVLRYNEIWGISDDVFLIGGGFMTEAIAEIQLLPIFMLTSLLCPKDHEATVLSIITSLRTACIILSKVFSSSLMSQLHIDKYSFDQLPKLIIICSVLSLLPIFLMPWISGKPTSHIRDDIISMEDHNVILGFDDAGQSMLEKKKNRAIC